MAGPAQQDSQRRRRSPRPASSPRPDVDSTIGLLTRSTYRGFLTRGLAPDEAANLTAFMCGIPVNDAQWSLRQVNQLLFLRALAQKGRFGSADGGRPRTH